MSSSTRRQEDIEYSSNTQQQQRQQHDATIRSIDETKDNIRRAIEEVRRETPRYSQTITDFQNETANASMEIADNFLESQKEVINSMQSAWDSLPQSTGGGRGGNYWTGGVMMTPFSFFSPREIANIYARTIGAITEAYVASTRMATNMLFAGIEATRATTNYARQNAKEASRITSNTARAFAHTAKETVQVQGEERGRSVGRSNISFGAGGGGSEPGSLESLGGTGTATNAAFATEGTTAASSGETGSTTTAGTGGAEKTRKK